MRCLVVGGLVLGLAAGPALAEDLMSIYKDALQQDPVYTGAKSAYAASKERLPQSRALFLPNINATANTTYNSTDIRYEPRPAGFTVLPLAGLVTTLFVVPCLYSLVIRDAMLPPDQNIMETPVGA